jgi:DNA-nicking Smr family endonuclease
MKARKTSLTLKSFQDIKDLVKNRSIELPSTSSPPVPKTAPEAKSCPETEEKLFEKAMEGVTPIARDNCTEKAAEFTFPEDSRKKEDAEVLERLTELIRGGEGFNVCDTPEYVEGTGYHIHPEIARRLHQGEYSIQAFVDLHGFTLYDAREAFEKFMKWAVMSDKTGVLIIHGRGLSSPGEPVLKKGVVEWLTRGPWRKWVVAYSSARICDGGAGATYVLLRRRPVSKRYKKSGARRRTRNEGPG